jgi:hypothetical protein
MTPHTCTRHTAHEHVLQQQVAFSMPYEDADCVVAVSLRAVHGTHGMCGCVQKSSPPHLCW